MSLPMLNRRDFCRSTPLWAATPFFAPIGKRPEITLRPPGAVPDFLSRCIRCGKCVEACPYDVIRLSGEFGISLHTPYVEPLKTPCYLCRQRSEDGKDRPLGRLLRCGEACPTGALIPIINTIPVLASVPKKYSMGLSRIDRNLCLAYQYDSCGECYYNCPLKDKAMLDRPPDYVSSSPTGIRPHVNEEHCIGCGMCGFVCPVKKEIADTVIRRDVRLTLYEERYAAMVRSVIGRAGPGTRLPAARVRGKEQL